MSGIQNKILGKRSKNAPVEFEVVALGNRKKTTTNANSNNNSNIGGGGGGLGTSSGIGSKQIDSNNKMEYDEKIMTAADQISHGNNGGGGVGSSGGNNTPIKKMKMDNNTNISTPGTTIIPPNIMNPTTSKPQPNQMNNNNNGLYNNGQSQSPLRQQQQQQLPLPSQVKPPPLQQQQQQQQYQANNNDSSTMDLIQLAENEKDVNKAIKIVKSILMNMRSHLLTSNIPSVHLFSSDNDRSPYTAFLNLVRRTPTLFTSGELLDTMLSFFRRDALQIGQPQRKNNLIYVFSCIVLYTAFENVADWPAPLFYIFVEDSIGDRLWVDDSNCKPFCQIIQSSIPNRNNQSSTINNNSNSNNSGSSSLPSSNNTSINNKPVTSTTNVSSQPSSTTQQNITATDSDEEIEEEIISSSTSSVIVQSTSSPTPSKQPISSTTSRFQHCQGDIVRYVIQSIRSFNANINARGLLRLLLLTVGFKESRAEGAQHVEQLIVNQSVFRAAKEYVQALLVHCVESSPEDIRAVQTLLKVQMSIDIVPTLLGNNPLYASIALRQAIELELELTPGLANKMAKSRLSTIFKHMAPLRAEEELSAIIKELALRDDYQNRVAAKMVVRKIIKQFPTINMPHFFGQLVDISRDEAYLTRDPQTKERWAQNLVHVCCQTLLLIPTSMTDPREAANVRAQLSSITANTVTWCSNLLLIFISSPHDIIDLIKKILFLDPINNYFPSPNTILDTDRIAYRVLSSEIQIQESIIGTILTMAKDNPLDKRVILDLIDVLLRRSLSISIKLGIPAQFNDGEIGQDVMMLSEIGTIRQISIANTALFWQAAITVCMLVCQSPATIGRIFWQACPTVRTLLEMIVTRLWKFPPFASRNISTAQSLQLDAQQKARESELLAVLSAHPQFGGGAIIILDLGGCARSPPDDIIERLQRMDAELHMSFMLCQSRQPDFLLDVMASQESRSSLQWLVHIINSDPRTLDILPPMCLAEVMLMSDSVSLAPIAGKLISRIGALVTASATSTTELIQFFFTQLASPSNSHRCQTRRVIASLPQLADPSHPFSLSISFEWIKRLSSLPWYDQVSGVIQQALLTALLVETDTNAIIAYFSYLFDTMTQPFVLLLQISKIMINRKMIARFILNHDYCKHSIFSLFSNNLSNYTTTQKRREKERLKGDDDEDEKMNDQDDNDDEEKEKEEEIIISININSNNQDNQSKSLIILPLIILNAIIYSICNVGGNLDSIQKYMDMIDRQLFGTNVSIKKEKSGEDFKLSNDQIVEALHSRNQSLIDKSISHLDTPYLIGRLCSMTISNVARDRIALHFDNILSDKSIDINIPNDQIDRIKDILNLYHSNGRIQNGKKLLQYLEVQQQPKEKEKDKDIQMINNNQLNIKSLQNLLINDQQEIKIDKMKDNEMIKQQKEQEQRKEKKEELLHILKLDNLTKSIKEIKLDRLEESLGNLFGRLYNVSNKSTTEKDHEMVIDSIVTLAIELPAQHPMIGLLLDWLMVLVTQGSPQWIVSKVSRLMFGLPRLPFATLLHTHFIHHAPWSTLSSFIDHLLKLKDNVDEQSVLTFINSYYSHPRSSAPYYSANPSLAIDSLLYQLSPTSTCLLADHIIQSYPNDSIATQKRNIVLLTSAARISPSHLSLLSNHLYNYNNNQNNQNNKNNSSSQNILLQLYYSYPTLIKSLLPNYSPPTNNYQINNNNQNNNIITTTIPTTQLDKPIHRVILKIYEPEHRNNAFVLFQRLAHDHPELITLHLPTILALFAGRSYLQLDQFFQKKYHILYQDILDILTLLNPHVFASDHLDPILTEYFLFLGNIRSYIDELSPIVYKFMSFLLLYKTLKPTRDIVNRNIDQLEILGNFYPNCKIILSKIQRNVDCFQIIDSKSITTNNNLSSTMTTMMTTITNDEHLMILKKLKNDLNEQINIGQKESVILGLLYGFEDLRTLIPPQILVNSIQEVLVQLLTCNRASVRILAYAQLQYLIANAPSTDLIQSYVTTSFHQDNPVVVRSTLKHIGSTLLHTPSSSICQRQLIAQMLECVGRDSLIEIKKFITPFIQLYS